MTIPKYTYHRVALTEDQLKEIMLAAKKRKRITIQLLRSSALDEYVGETHIVSLPLTHSQLLSISRISEIVNLTFSAAQLDHLIKSGGFLPLLALLPLLFGGLAAAGGISGGIASAVSAASNSKASAAAQIEAERHNREIEAQLKSGSGVSAAHGASVNSSGSGTGVISDKIQDIPLLGALAPYLRKIGLGACQCRDILENKLVHTKHGLEAKLGYGIFLGPRGDGIFLGPQGKGIFLGPQKAKDLLDSKGLGLKQRLRFSPKTPSLQTTDPFLGA